MQIDLGNVLPGDAIEFKRHGFTAGVLGWLLKRCAPSWDGWGWHLAIMWEKQEHGWTIFQSTAKGVNKRYYRQSYLEDHCRFYRWLDAVPIQIKLEDFYRTHVGCKYDVGIYLWSSFQYLIRHFLNHRIPYLLDNRYTCWELVTEFFDFCGKRVINIYDCPMIPDILEKIKS